MPGNDVGDRVHNFFAPDNLSQGQHQSQLVDGNWPQLGNNLWVGSQRHVGGLSSSPKNYNLHQSDTEIGHGAHSLQVPHGMNFTQSTLRPDFAKSQSQSLQPNLNGYVHGRQVFQARQNEEIFLGVDTESDQTITSRGFSVYESQQGNGPEHQKNYSARSGTSESPVRFDFLGGQQQMSGQPLSRQHSGFNEMQLLQQQLIYRKMQELQRQQQFQQLEARQQNSVNQMSAISKQGSGNHLSSMMNGTSIGDMSPYHWPNDTAAGNTNWSQRGSPVLEGSSNGLVFSPDQGQPMRFTGMVPQQVDQSLYGVPVSSTRGTQNLYSHIPIDKPPMQQVLAGTSSFPGNQYAVFPDQVNLQDGTLVSRQGFQGKNGMNVENLQQIKALQRNVSVQEFHGRHELAGPSEPSQEKSMMQIAPSDVALDPTEEKILFGTDDNLWDAFGGDTNMGAGGSNPVDGNGFLDGFPSVQSGSWSALMQSAVAETTSNDMGRQEEWSGLSFQNSELRTEHRRPSTYDDSGKQQTVFSDSNLHIASALNSGSVRFSGDSNVNNNHESISGFQQSGLKMPYDSGESLNRVPLQRPCAEPSQIYHHSLDAEMNAKSASGPWAPKHSTSAYNTGGQTFNKQHGLGVFESASPSGDAVLKMHEKENSSKQLRSNDQNMYEEMGHGGGIWKADHIPNSSVELDSVKSSMRSPQLSRQDSGLNNVDLVPNSSTTRARQETSQLSPHSLYPHWKDVDSSSKRAGTEALGKFHHHPSKGPQVLESALNSFDNEAVKMHENENSDKKENSTGSLKENVWSDVGGRKTSGQGGRKTSGPPKFQYHPMGNLDEDLQPSYGTKNATQLQGMSQQISRGTNSQNQGYFGQSNFFGQVPKSSLGREQGHFPDLRGSTKALDEAHSRQILPGYVPNTAASFDRSVGVSVPNKAAESSQNMLELIHKVDQSRENVTPMHFSSSEHHPSSEMHETDNSDGSVGHFQQNQSSASQGFRLQLAPPSQGLPVPQRAFSSQNSAKMVSSLSSSLTTTEMREKGRTWLASTPQIQSSHPSPETSQGELRSGKNDLSQQTGNETLSSALNSGFPYSRSQVHSQHMTSTSGQMASRALTCQSASSSLPETADSTRYNNPASYADTPQPTIPNQSREGVFAQQISDAKPVSVSQPFATFGISQNGASSKMLPNAWTSIPAQQHVLRPQTQKGPLNLFQSHHSNNNVEATQNFKDKCPPKGANASSEFGPSSINSGGSAHEEEKAVKDSHSQQGKESIVEHFSDATHSNLRLAQKDIEAFGRSLKPNNFLNQNYSLLNQMQAIRSTEADPSDRGLKRMKGMDSGLKGQQVQSNEQNTIGGMLSFSGPVSSRERNASSQHGKLPSQDMPAFSRNDPQGYSRTGSTASVRAETSGISPQMAPSWFNQFGSFKNGQILPMYDAQKAVSATSLEQPSALGKSSDSLQAQVNSTEQVNSASGTSQVGDACQSVMPSSIATEHFSFSQSLPANVTDQHLVVSRPKKRKTATSELFPWYKEVTHDSQKLLSVSMSELDWAKAANRLIDKVEDGAEIIGDGPPVLRSKRRLIFTSHLMQQLLRPPPAVVLSADASSDHESVTYFAARVALGDACSLTSSLRSNSHGPLDGINPVSNKQKTSERTDDQHLSRVTEDIIGRARKLEDNLSRLDKQVSILDLRVESQELEKFSVINRFAKFHGRGQAEGAEASSSSDAASNNQKPYPQRYVTGLSMPRILPDRVQCLSL